MARTARQENAPASGESQRISARGDQPARPETVVVLDFGSQYSMLIARRVRECHVYCELLPHDAPREEIERLQPRAFILSGGPASVYDDDAPQAPDYVFESGVPVLGICYGMQLLAHQLGGKVAKGAAHEYGHAVIERADGAGVADALFEGLPDSLPVWMSHGDRIVELPDGFHALASSDSSPFAVMGNDAGLIGLQFHPEVVHTPQGKEILRNFLFRVSGCTGDWTAGNVITESVERIRLEVGSDRVLCALSGGVDSAVAAALVHRAVGDQITCVFVDNGLLRREEAERVVATFERHMEMRLVHVDAVDRFLEKLAGVVDPEEKRLRIGETFIRVFEEESRKLGRFEVICQGTTYPDVIESAVPETRGSPAARRPRRRSSRTTTSAGCRRRWTSGSSSRCGTSSRTRCARSVSPSACPRRWSTASPSPAQAWRSASSAR